MRYNDNIFDYDSEGIVHRKQFSNGHEIVKSEDFKQWILSLKPKYAG